MVGFIVDKYFHEEEVFQCFLMLFLMPNLLWKLEIIETFKVVWLRIFFSVLYLNLISVSRGS